MGYDKPRFGPPQRRMKQTRKTKILGHASVLKHKTWKRY
jgi:hypothetical protein